MCGGIVMELQRHIWTLESLHFMSKKQLLF
jgi:hypothetical protein